MLYLRKHTTHLLSRPRERKAQEDKMVLPRIRPTMTMTISRAGWKIEVIWVDMPENMVAL